MKPKISTVSPATAKNLKGDFDWPTNYCQKKTHINLIELQYIQYPYLKKEESFFKRKTSKN